MEPVEGQVSIFLHFVLASRQAGSQLVMDVVETKCGHRFGESTVEELRAAAAMTYSGILKCPNCNLEVHHILPMTAMGGVTLPRLASIAPVPPRFEELLPQPAPVPIDGAAAPGAGAAPAAPADGTPAAGAGPSGAGPSGLLRRISFVPGQADYDPDSPAYRPVSPVFRAVVEEISDDSDEEEEENVAPEPVLVGLDDVNNAAPAPAPAEDPDIAPLDFVEFENIEGNDDDLDHLLDMLEYGEP